MGKIYFISSGSEITENLFTDLNNNPDVIYLHEPIKHVSGFLKSVFVKYSKINNRIPLHINRLWYSIYSLSDLDLKDDDIVVLMNGAFNYYDAAYINYIRKNNNAKFACIFIDPVNRLANDRILNQILISKMDFIGTFDKRNADQYGWHFIGNIYSKKEMESNNEPEIDLYFLGVNKDNRLDILSQIVDKSEELRKLFILSGHCLRDTWKKDILCKSISYEENISNLMKSNCLLELIQEGQVGATARYCEAIVYGKKLLTNNSTVRFLPFYNEEYIKIFDKVDDIDFDWVKEIIPVDFEYKGEFSPNHIIERIQRYLEREN